MELHLRSRAKSATRRIGLMSCMLVAVLSACWLSTVPASALYILTGEDDSAIVLDENADVKDFSSKLVYVGTNASGFELTLTAGQNVTVLYDGASIAAVSQEETISALLNRLHATPAPLDIVAVDLNDNGVTLNVGSDLTYHDRVMERDAYSTICVSDATLAKGEQEVTQYGEDGVRTAVYEVVYSDGKLESRQLVAEEDSTAVDEIVRVGTSVKSVSGDDRILDVKKNSDGSGTLVFSSGATMNFSGTKNMTATAYTSGSGGADDCTATGTAARVGAVAVDRKVIPLGTRMYIVTAKGDIVYGMAVAEDTGVRGNTVDLYYDTYQQCIEFGRRPAMVYLLD